MFDITAIGEILIDLTQSSVNEQGIPVFTANPGGAPANLAVAASRLGASAAFIGKVGADSFGNLLRQTLIENNVNVAGLSTDTSLPTTLAVVSLDASGERSFSFYRNPSADVNLQSEDISPEQVTATRFLHFGSVSLTTNPARSTTLSAVTAAKQAGAIISYDPNYRARLWPDEETAIQKMAEPLPLVDILKISDEELPLLAGTSDLEEGALKLEENGIKLILITLGADGVFYRFRNQTGHIPGVPCQVGDTNGAGDTFLGAALAQLAKHPDVDNLSISDLEQILAFSNKAASITASRHGAIPAMPSYSEVFC